MPRTIAAGGKQTRATSALVRPHLPGNIPSDDRNLCPGRPTLIWCRPPGQRRGETPSDQALSTSPSGRRRSRTPSSPALSTDHLDLNPASSSGRFLAFVLCLHPRGPTQARHSTSSTQTRTCQPQAPPSDAWPPLRRAPLPTHGHGTFRTGGKASPATCAAQAPGW